MRLGILLSLLLIASAYRFADAQESDFHRNNITFGSGPAIPMGRDTSYLSTAPLITVGYGYRFSRLFQADVGFQAIFGAASNQNPVVTDLGYQQGGDREYMIPFGGRLFLPLPSKRFETSIGLGGIHLHYSETAPSNYYYPVNCYTCTSRGGWGGYGLINLSYFLDDSRMFHVGTTYEFVAGSTNGQAVGNVPVNKTTDHWSNLSIEFGLSF